MKITNLKKKSDKQIIQMKKDLEMGLIKASGKWGTGNVSRKESGETKGVATMGEKTKMRRDIKRNLAQLNTMLNQRGLSAERCKGKPLSKRRIRRLKGREKGIK